MKARPRTSEGMPKGSKRRRVTRRADKQGIIGSGDTSISKNKEADQPQDILGRDHSGKELRSTFESERSRTLQDIESKSEQTPGSLLIKRKLKLQDRRHACNILDPISRSFALPPHVQGLPPEPSQAAVDDITLATLEAICSTPFENCFLSRLHGCFSMRNPGLLHIDWETTSPWMKLMQDVREHHHLAWPDHDHPGEIRVPIQYVWLQEHHLPQVHNLLHHTFWPGIDVSDSLKYSPEQCTVVVLYGSVVVGFAVLSSPVETYITYLAVRSGWENAQIATIMLYLLIVMNPNRDITLHVSANNPAMLLYNRFGFKAEGFVAGFYDAYLDPRGRQSKNAYHLRLRR